MYEFVDYRVADAMTPSPMVLPPSSTLGEAERIFERRGFNLLPVVDRGRMVGVLSRLDLLKAFAFANSSIIPRYGEIMSRPVSEYMNTAPFTMDPQLPLTRALQRMVETHCKSLPVVEGDGVVGIVTREDIGRALRCAVAGGGREALRSRRWRGSLRDHGFLAEVAGSVPCGPEVVETIIGAVFAALHDQLTPEEAGDVLAQLPKALKRLWTECDRPGHRPGKIDRREFIARVRKQARLASDAEAERAVRAVFRALQTLLGSPHGGLDGESWDVFSQLPKDLKKLWIEAARA